MNLQIKDLIDRLSANEKVIGLVKIMKPLDIIAVISSDLGLMPDIAKHIVKNLLKNAYLHGEGMASPGIETNKQYPVPAKIKRDNEDLDEDAGNFINNLGALTPDIKGDQFPQPREDPEGWPYDDATVATMDIHNKSNKRGLTSGKRRKGKIVKEREIDREKFKGPLEPDLTFNQPGGDGAGGGGIYQKNTAYNRSNSTPTSGGSYDAKGVEGWSSSPPGKTFQSNVELNVDTSNDDKPGHFDDEAPVGSAIPKLGDGGRNPGRRMGFTRR